MIPPTRSDVETASLTISAGTNSELARSLIDDDLDHAAEVRRCTRDSAVERGSSVAGYKIGLTSGAARHKYSSPSPQFGYVFDETIRESGSTIDLAPMYFPRLEAEVCFELAADLPPGQSIDDIRNAVGSISLAFELIDSRVGDWPADLSLLIADNCACAGVIVGNRVADLAQFSASIDLMLGGVSHPTIGHQPFDDHLERIAWLAIELDRCDDQLLAGQLIVTGTWGAPASVVGAGEAVASSLTMPAVRCTFVGAAGT